MTTATVTQNGTVLGRGGNPPARRLGLLSLIAAVYTWALVVFGGVVRITGSGLGCGEDWPRCNGEWIPAFTFETIIEYTHRLLAAGIGIVVLAVVGYALLMRGVAGVGGRGGQLRPLMLAAALFVFQALLGALTVWLGLSTAVTIAHFVTALLFMATFIVAAVRGGALGTMSGSATEMSRKIASWALGAAATGLVVVAFGAMTANTAGAAAACTGFPLCNGQLLPQAGAVPVEIHWAHRVAAFSLFFVTLAGAWTAHRHAAPRPLRRAAVVAVVLIVLQLAVAASLVLLRLPQLLQAAHLAVGAAVWFALAAWAALSRTGSRTPLDPKGIGV